MSGYYEQCKCGEYTDHAPCSRCMEKEIVALRDALFGVSWENLRLDKENARLRNALGKIKEAIAEFER